MDRYNDATGVKLVNPNDGAKCGWANMCSNVYKTRKLCVKIGKVNWAILHKRA